MTDREIKSFPIILVHGPHDGGHLVYEAEVLCGSAVMPNCLRFPTQDLAIPISLDAEERIRIWDAVDTAESAIYEIVGDEPEADGHFRYQFQRIEPATPGATT